MLSGQRQSAIFQLHINLRLHSNTRRCLKAAEDSRTTGPAHIARTTQTF